MEKYLVRLPLFASGCLTLTLLLGGMAGAQAAAPELDPGSTTSGIVLLVEGALFPIERYRRRHR